MSFLRDNPRKLKSATQSETINRVLEKYVDFKNLYLRLDFSAEPVEFLEHIGDDTLLIRLDKPLEETSIEVYTVVQERFIDFNLELVSSADPTYPEFSYIMRILNCSIALEKREHERIRFAEELPLVSNIATIKVRERETDFRKSLSVRMIVEEYINKLDGVDHKKVIFKDDKDLPPTVRYVIESGKTLHIVDTADTSGFFAENEKYFNETNSVVLKEELRQWLQNNTANVTSILVKPIFYYPLVGTEFPIGYLNVINKDRPIEAGQVEHIDAFIEDLSERIRNGNLFESKIGGTIIDVSAGGVKIELADSKLVEKLLSQNIIVFEMNFKDNNPLLISGRLVYVYKRDDGHCILGIDFSGSRFGPRIKNVLPIHVKHFLYRKKRST
jgi:Protein of unknown function (DUF1577).